MQVPSTFHVVSYVVNSGNIITATANLTLEKNGEKISGVATGDGPIDAAFHAIEQIVGHHYELDDFQIQSITKGREAVGSSLIRLRAKGKLYSGTGVSTDIVGASIRAYINALNKIVYEEN
jgi:2-isopropylmalate synthase